MRVLPTLLTGIALALSPCLLQRAWAQQVQITRLADFSFGVLATTAGDVTQSRNVCVSATSLGGGYSIRAIGSGGGGAFTLAGAGAPMAYDVQWAARPNQSNGVALQPGTTRGGLVSTALGLNLGCVLGNDSASLIIALRAADLSAATAGVYTGTLTLLVAAE